MLEARWDEFKSNGQIRKEIDKCCDVEGCDQPLTHFKGPGGILCREHQLNLREYGGTGRIDRPHTHHRRYICDGCDKDVRIEVGKKYPDLKESDPDLFYRLCRNRIIGDHIIREADGGDNSAENVQSLCLDCNSDKTIISKDYRPANTIA
jgi:5-methylcytosine-specific restriction endonuclease McrA